MLEVKAPNQYDQSGYMIFLAGAIDTDSAPDWQAEVVKQLADFDVTILNPRRDNWDSSWKQSKDDPQFCEQVHWELDALDAADLILCVFTKDAKETITFLELGLHARDNITVCCPEGFYRKGNVDIVCGREGISVYETLEGAVAEVKAVLKAAGIRGA
jgi:hypothetical protein